MMLRTKYDRELIIPAKKSKVKLLGYDKPLKWSLTVDGGVGIEIPNALRVRMGF